MSNTTFATSSEYETCLYTFQVLKHIVYVEGDEISSDTINHIIDDLNILHDKQKIKDKVLNFAEKKNSLQQCLFGGLKQFLEAIANPSTYRLLTFD